MEKKSYAKITERKFQCIKILLESGSTYKEVSEYMECSQATVGRIKFAASYQEYLDTMAAEQRASKAKRRAALAAAEKAAKALETAKNVNSVPAETAKEENKPEPQVVEHRQTVQIQATHYMMQEMQKTNELLKLISNKLAFIVEELTGKGEEDS